MIVGGVTPFGLPESLPIWIDKAVMERNLIIVGGGSRDQKIKINPNALLSLRDVEIIEDLAKIPEDS